jgi:hypothetical protein
MSIESRRTKLYRPKRARTLVRSRISAALDQILSARLTALVAPAQASQPPYRIGLPKRPLRAPGSRLTAGTIDRTSSSTIWSRL